MATADVYHVHTPAAHDERWLRWLETQDYRNDERIHPLWLAAKATLFNDRDALLTLRARLNPLSTRDRMAQTDIPTVLRNTVGEETVLRIARGEEKLELDFEPLVVEMVEWLRATERAEGLPMIM